MDNKPSFTQNQMLLALRAIAEPTRLRIFTLCSRAELTVSDLTELLRQSQPRISRHLKILCESGVLERAQEGTFAFYRIAMDGIGHYLQNHILSACEIRMQDERHLAALKDKKRKLSAPYEAANAEQIKKLQQYYPSEKLIDHALKNILDIGQINDFLDIGTGTGHMLKLFGPKVTHALGIDLSRQMLSVARVNLMLSDIHNCRLQQADMYHLPLPDGSFDAVVVHHVLHFSEQPGKVIAEAARVLRPNGQLVIVDFMAHQNEDLRSRFHHHSLGFEEGQLKSWMLEYGLAPQPVTIIAEPGKALRVFIFSALKHAVKSRSGKPKSKITPKPKKKAVA